MRRAAAAAAALALAGCGSNGNPAVARPALQAYVARVEPIRLGVNRLLDRADPILSAYHDHRLGRREARRRMDALERRFAVYTVKIAALRPVPAAIRAVHEAYAHTYVLEDAYLSALAAALPDREFDNLPRTQDRQRASIMRACRSGKSPVKGRPSSSCVTQPISPAAGDANVT